MSKSKAKLPPLGLLLASYALIVSITGTALVLLHGPAEPLILFIGPVIFVALFYPRRAFLPMILLLAEISAWVIRDTSEDFLASFGAVAVFLLAMAISAEVIHRLMLTRAQAQEETNQLLQALVGASPLAILTLDVEDKVKMWSKAAECVFGWSEQEVLGRPNPIIPESKREEFRDMQERLRQGETFANVETRRLRKDGSLIDVSISTAPLRDSKGEFVGSMAVIADIAERKRTEEMMHFQAYHDPLTGLPNRLLFNDCLTMALSRVRRTHQRLAVMFLDLDHFKNVNDMLGHSAGDQLLQAVGHRLAGCVREADTIARLGGDEFTVLLEIGSVEDAAKLAQRILEG
ncbi:MAG: diguanylate cyclase, partial [Chloroflexi bacterium]|nr:diguanylate cyclase [Chloroflexota bacterium]